MINNELVDERHPVVHIVVDAIVEALTHVRQHPVSRGQIFVTCKGSHFEGLNHYEARYFVYGIKPVDGLVRDIVLVSAILIAT